MKIKKVLCLGAVLGAVLSVGMLTSAMAAKPEDVTAVAQGSYALNPTELGTLLTADNSYTTEGFDYHGIKFSNIVALKNEGKDEGKNEFIKMDTNSTISFYVAEACDLYIGFDISDPNDSSLSLYSGDNADQVVESTLKRTANKAVSLTTDTLYTIKGPASENDVRLTELYFLTTGKTPESITVVSPESRIAKGTETGRGCVAIAKDSSNQYYGIVLVNQTNVTANAGKAYHVTIKDKALPTDITTVYANVDIDGVPFGPSWFGQNADFLYAFKINGIVDDNDAIAILSSNSASTGVDVSQVDITNPQP